MFKFFLSRSVTLNSVNIQHYYDDTIVITFKQLGKNDLCYWNLCVVNDYIQTKVDNKKRFEESD